MCTIVVVVYIYVVYMCNGCVLFYLSTDLATYESVYVYQEKIKKFTWFERRTYTVYMREQYYKQIWREIKYNNIWSCNFQIKREQKLFIHPCVGVYEYEQHDFCFLFLFFCLNSRNGRDYNLNCVSCRTTILICISNRCMSKNVCELIIQINNKIESFVLITSPYHLMFIHK